jgi:leucyl/phenylalanyl-tRNA--protein transferase
MFIWLDDDTPFPPPECASRSPNGLLAAGASLTVARLLAAYRQGIFPWFQPGQPVLWWSPEPRTVLFPEEFRLHRSLRRTLIRHAYTVRLDTAFAQVVAGCATTARPGQDGTWITAEMQAAYTALHELGFAHSVETWIEGELAGGLYGVALGRVFFGESMFTRRRDASKIAFAHLVRYLQQEGFAMIDCQMHTEHLASLGARSLPRAEFTARLGTLVEEAPRHAAPGRWPAEAAADLWSA